MISTFRGLDRDGNVRVETPWPLRRPTLQSLRGYAKS